MKRKKHIFITLLVGAMLSSCSGSSDALLDGDATQTALKLQMASATSSATNSLSRLLLEESPSFNVGPVIFSSGSVCVKRIKLELPEGMDCQQADFVEQEGVTCQEEEEIENDIATIEAEIKIEGPIVFDLIDGSSSPDVSNITVPSGNYKEIEIEFSDECPELGGETLVAAGSFTALDTSVHDFELGVTFTEELEFENTTGVNVLENASNDVVVGLNVAGWFDGIDIAQCVADGDLSYEVDGSLVINENTSGINTCENIDEAIADNIEASIEMEDDEEESESE